MSSARLPDFFIAGAMRSGTTSMTRYLDSHPQAFMAKPKELHFFDLNFDRGLEWYESHFSGAGGDLLAGDGTPSYMYSPEAVTRMAQTAPGARLIVLLRNPVDRAYSHYWLRRGLGSEPLNFEDAVAVDAQRIELGDPRRACPYLDLGRYLPQLERICDHFPRSALHVALFERMRDDPAGVYAAVCRHLGIDDRFVPPGLGRVVNRNLSHRSAKLRKVARHLPNPLRRAIGFVNTRQVSYPTMDADLRAHLLEQFAPINAALEQWLGADLSSWSR
jgi:hypothetical protein